MKIFKKICLKLTLFVVYTLSSNSYASFLDCIIFPEDFINSHSSTYQLLYTLKMSPKAEQLIESIKERYTNIHVSFSENCFTEGNFSYQTGEMNISTKILNNPNTFCAVFLWEACNADNFYLTLPSQFSRSSEEYAFFTEAAEHQTLVRRTEILKEYMNKVQENPQLKKMIETSTNMDISKIIHELDENPKKSFKYYWEQVNILQEQEDKYIHAEIYKNFFNENKSYFQGCIIKSYNSQILDLIKYSFSYWEDNENIPHISIDTQEFYKRVLRDLLTPSS